jgi:UDP-N-acetylbacillosamine N-acetyltransferase
MANPKIPLIIWGASGHAKVIADAVMLLGDHEILGYLDDTDPKRWNEPFYGGKILGGQEYLDKIIDKWIKFIIGFGSCLKRLEKAEIVTGMGFELTSIIHPDAYVSRSATIGVGTFVGVGATINASAEVHANVIINSQAVVGHDCIIEDGVHICPAKLAGSTTIGRGSWIGIGSTIIDHIHIGKECYVGAGSLVVTDLPDKVLAYGVPATIQKDRYITP